MPSATLKQRFENDPLARLVPPAPITEAEFPMPRPKSAIDAELASDSEFLIYDVPETGNTGFTHFLDGAQKVWKVLYYGFDPVVLAHTSAAVIERSDRQMLAMSDDLYDGGLDAFGVNKPELVERFQGVTKGYYPTTLEDHWSPQAVGEQIRELIGGVRQAREWAVAERFEGGFLLVDGPINSVSSLLRGKQHAGVVKSHERLYVKDPERQRQVFSMKRGQRSSVFLRPGGKRNPEPAFSFYLRLREGQFTEPVFGMVRVELPSSPEWLPRVDEIAGWLLAETRPLSLPDPRFHVLPYPIHLLEKHLKARQPSDASIRGLLGI